MQRRVKGKVISQYEDGGMVQTFEAGALPPAGTEVEVVYQLPIAEELLEIREALHRLQNPMMRDAVGLPQLTHAETDVLIEEMERLRKAAHDVS